MSLGSMLVVSDGAPPAAAAEVQRHSRALVQDLDRGGVERIEACDSSTALTAIIGSCFGAAVPFRSASLV
jgi:hypothetical protein